MADQKKPGFATASIHAGQSPDPTTLARGVSIARTSSFVFKSAEHAANLFALKEFGNIYTRLGNPTTAILEDRITALEGGAASVATASGTAAIFNTIITIARVGDHIVSASNLYGGTYTMFSAILPDLGITTSFVDVRDPANFEKAITDKTRLLYIETIGNPALDVGRYRSHQQDRQEAQTAAGGGCHFYHTLFAQIDRTRRRHCGAITY